MRGAAAGLVRALRALLPEATFSGVGGDALQAEGMTLAYHARDMAVMGFNEVVRRLGFFRRVFADLKRRAAAERPDAVIKDYIEKKHPDIGKICRFAPEIFSIGLEPNPRKVKRGLNIYRTTYDLAETR
mgnify:CR=1 FL=1